MTRNRKTQLIHSGRKTYQGMTPVNPPVMRASTILFESLEIWRDVRKRRENERLLSYGARGTDNAFALEQLVTRWRADTVHGCSLRG